MFSVNWFVQAFVQWSKPLREPPPGSTGWPRSPETPRARASSRSRGSSLPHSRRRPSRTSAPLEGRARSSGSSASGSIRLRLTRAERVINPKHRSHEHMHHDVEHASIVRRSRSESQEFMRAAPGRSMSGVRAGVFFSAARLHLGEATRVLGSVAARLGVLAHRLAGAALLRGIARGAAERTQVLTRLGAGRGRGGRERQGRDARVGCAARDHERPRAAPERPQVVPHGVTPRSKAKNPRPDLT